MTNYKALLGSYSGYVTANVAKLTSNIAQFIRPMLNSALAKLKSTPLKNYLLYLGAGVASFSGVYIYKLTHKKDQDGKTPLHKAAEKGELSKANKLIALWANVNAKDNSGATALHLAISSNQQDIAELLLMNKNTDVNAIDKYDQTPLDCAEKVDNQKTIDLLNARIQIEAEIKKRGDVNAKYAYAQKTLLHKYSEKGELDQIKVLINCFKADVNAKDREGSTPLHIAAGEGHLDVIKELINQGATIDARDKYGHTPLHFAAGLGHLDVIKELINQGATIDARDGYGQTPLHKAAGKGQLDAIKGLIAFRADVNAKDEYNQTPLHIAAGVGHLDVIKGLINQGATIDARDKYGHTPLHFAAGVGHLDVIKGLINQGATIDARDKDHRTPFDLVSKKHKAKMAEIINEALAKKKDGFEPIAPHSSSAAYHEQDEEEAEEELSSDDALTDGAGVVVGDAPKLDAAEL